MDVHMCRCLDGVERAAGSVGAMRRGARMSASAVMQKLPERVTVALVVFVFQAEDGIRDVAVTGVQTCALPIYSLRFAFSKIAAPLQNQARQFFHCRLGQHQQARMLYRFAKLLAEDLDQVETEGSLADRKSVV